MTLETAALVLTSVAGAASAVSSFTQKPEKPAALPEQPSQAEDPKKVAEAKRRELARTKAQQGKEATILGGSDLGDANTVLGKNTILGN